MKQTVTRDFVPGGSNPRHNFRLFLGHPAQDEKGRQTVILSEQRQEPVGIRGNAARVSVPFLDAHLPGVGADVEIIFKVNR